MASCKGIIHCNRKTCLEMSICEKSLDYSRDIYVKQQSPVKRQNAVLVWTGQKKVSTPNKKKKKEKKPEPPKCPLNCKWMCSILGQCVMDHPLVKSDKAAPKQLRGASSRKEVMEVIERLMPALNRGNWKKRKQKV